MITYKKIFLSLAFFILLLIVVSFGVPSISFAQVQTITKSYAIDANNRDAWSGDSHSGNPNFEVRIDGYNSTSEPYEFTGSDSDGEVGGMEFALDVPQGATITNAYVTVKAGSSQSTSSTGALELKMYDFTNVAPFANGFT